jgi:energy-coupling factor transporter ATP-binding protein EcfA2
MGASTSRPPELVAAEVRQYDAQTAAITLRSAAEASAVQKRAVAGLLPWLVGAGVVVAVAADIYLHESPTHIKRRMHRTLALCKPPSTLAPPPKAPLPVIQEPLWLGFLPTLILGPSGCGKSTLLSGIVSSLPKPAPVVLVRMRLPAMRSAASTEVAGEGLTLLNDTAKQVFSQIGYPLRRSFFGGILSRGITLGKGQIQVELQSHETRDRLVSALRMLFEVCEELKLEREKTLGPLDAAPVLLFDEVQDLIKDDRLKLAGGEVILKMLGTLLVAYCVDRRAVRAAVAGSSAELYFAFAACSPLHNARWKYYDLKDPGQAAVTAALEAQGYTTEEALSMVELCGTRLRLLEVPLTEGKLRCSAARFISSSLALGSSAFAAIFSKLSKADAAQLCKLLDGIEACEAAQDAAAQKVAAQEVVARPTKDMLPAALIHADVAPILFVTRENEYFFQSHLHRRTWLLLRSKYRAQSLEPALSLR